MLEAGWFLHLFLVTPAAFLAGAVNALAGGGSFLTLPALMMIGVPGTHANATSAAAVLPGYMGGAAGFQKELAGYDRAILIKYCLYAMTGSVVGASLLILTPYRMFDFIVPLLLLVATLLFAFNKTLMVRLKLQSGDGQPLVPPFGGMFVVAVYGGYFNGGLGIILLALFTAIGMKDIHIMNGLKSVISFILSLVSVTCFIIAGLIEWQYAIPMMGAASLGGFVGAKLSKQLSREFVRTLVTLIGFFMTGWFIYRLVSSS